jgi:hypothetical protein
MSSVKSYVKQKKEPSNQKLLNDAITKLSIDASIQNEKKEKIRVSITRNSDENKSK